jgi:hypothetical protein
MGIARTKIFNDQVTEYGGAMRQETGVKIIYQPMAIDANGNKSIGAKVQSQTHLIVQSFNIGVQRPLQTIFDLTTNYVFYVAGKVQSSVGVEKIVGPKGIMSDFYAQFGDICANAANLVWFVVDVPHCSDYWATQSALSTDGTGGATSTAFKDYAGQANVVEVSSVQLQGVTFTANVQNYLVTESCQMQGLDVSLNWFDMVHRPYITPSGALVEELDEADIISQLRTSV